jgi:PRC-barrel domain
MDAHKCRCDLARTTDLQQSDGVGKLLQIPTLAGLVLMASVTFAVAAAAQQPAPPPLVQPAPAPDVPTEQAVPAPLVVPAEQVAPVELTGLLGHAVVGVGGSGLGRIVDLLADGQGRVRAVVVDVGGFIGVGNRKVAVAWSALRFAPGEKGPVISIVIPPDRIKSWADYIAGRPVAILGAPDSGQ